jgi:leucyl-tRNA synthetase
MTSNDKILFHPEDFEKKWQKAWEEKDLFSPDLKNAKRPFYNLMMFPYPSAEGLHVGNMYAFTGADVYARFKRMQGNDVFEPIGLDGFGIHSENYALKVGRHPAEQAKLSEENFYRQLRSVGNSFDWKRTLETYDEEYYRWTQWLFIQLFKAGLAYRKKAEVNWCPSCKTVLSDEQVIDGNCERCNSEVEKRELEQWFFRITKYAQRLLDNIEKLDWTEKVKIAQKNWIGKSEGARIEFKIDNSDSNIEVFTTRPDTLFGATFIVLSPEHSLVEEVSNSKYQIPNEIINGVKNYIKLAKSKTNSERVENDKEKTGVFSGLYAVNPVNNERLPIWIADYVLMGYGTGAIMAVPAHDQRDFDFALKYDLPIKQVIAPYVVVAGPEAPRSEENIVEFDASTAIIRHWEDENLFYVVEFSDGLKGLVGGSLEGGEDFEAAVRRESTEESGYTDIKNVVSLFDSAYSRGFKTRKQREELCRERVFVIELGSNKRIEMVDVQIKKGEWMTAEEILESEAIMSHHKFYFEHYFENKAFTGSGIVINSGDWNGLRVPDEIGKVVTLLEEKGLGKREANFHLRDWLISRQRYWGPPIPMTWCETCAKNGKGEREEMPGWYSIPEASLPVLLPDVEDWKPMGTGLSPLANHPEFYETTCPVCSSPAKRETDVSDTFLDSAWYFLRYTSIDTESSPYDTEIVKKWLPVATYIGGAEHSVLHLLYSRFITMVLADLKMLDFEEPFTKFFAHGLIIKDGVKMSKSRGNVVVPDEYIQKYGADTLRMYLMFIGQFSQGGDFRDTGIEGMHRFAKRVWKLFESVSETSLTPEGLKFMHKTIKSVTEDISKFSYNTSIARLMEWYNFLISGSDSTISKEEAETFLKLLAPFAPHMTEELWEKMGNSGSIHLSQWPEFDEESLVEDEVTIAVQINGKMRGTLAVNLGSIGDKAELEARAKEVAQKHLDGKSIIKTIHVPGKVVNFVV